MTSNNPLSETNSVLNSATSAGLASVWATMDASPLLAKPFMFDVSSLMPDYNKMMSPMLADISKTVASAMDMAYPSAQLAGIQKMIIDASGVNNVAKMFLDSHTQMMRGLYPSLNIMAGLGLQEQFQLPVAALAKSLAASIDTSYINGVLADAIKFRAEVAEQDLDDLTDDFFENHPDLAESIEELPALYALSKADRTVVVWFVRFAVMMAVTCVILNINTEYPDLEKIVAALGLSGGWEAGKKAGEVTGKALDKLPQAEES
ncbi:hypothetical protein HAV21_03425 [Paenarthrobacter sp. MSM-2-10-13]|uniref:hypothetical protein n=1 Tax=Paenarthrobacter sp. MSM-2-10-13 TaxID=2717318 RepID=UPI001420B8A8|nr:hypothetical protein [Paenarthrobacter sp. MSM-2-10-13]NHW45948.1 hypothetical protein [Paenarthrobacter sp. MSM-2-10-13]